MIPARYLIWLIVAASVLQRAGRVRAGADDRRPRRRRPSRRCRAGICCAIRFSSRWWRRRASSRPATRSITVSRRCNGAAPASTARPSRRCGRSACSRKSCCSRSRDGCRRSLQPIVLLMIGAVGGALRWTGDGVRSAGCWRCRGCNYCTRCRSVPRISARSDLSRATRRPARARPRKAISSIAQGVGDGGGDRTVGMAVRRFRRPRLCGDGASGGRWRRLRCVAHRRTA